MPIKKFIYTNEDRLSLSGTGKLIPQLLSALHIELCRLRQSMYGPPHQRFLFAQNEQAWVGMISNALVRHFPETVSTLMEYGVYDEKEKFKGRADLLIEWNETEREPVYLLVEAKQYEEKSKREMLKNSTDFLDGIRKQAQIYYNAEKKYYENKNVHLIAIAFGWIRKPKLMETALEYMKTDVHKDPSVDFCALYHEEENGVWAYGRIYKVD